VTRPPILKRPAAPEPADADFLAHVEQSLGRAARPVPAAPVRAAQPPARGSEVVLVVDDEPPVRMLTGHMLQALGYRLLEAGTTEEAVRIAGAYKARIHLVLTDVRMPLGGGQALTTVLKARHPDLRVLWMSGYADDPAVRRAIADKKVQFLAKPFSMADLARTVRHALDAA
jgi:two-component system cell cycle sensor histidine kinase/response regulator CckA